MKQLKILLIVVLATHFCLAQTKEFRQLDSIFNVLYQQNQFNGSVLIADKGNIIYEKGFGLRNETTKKENNTNTIFELASCSKQFTAAGIVLLKRQGKLNYTDKITRYIPELKQWDKITIYDLLRHTSGIPDYIASMTDNWDPNKIATNNDVIQFYANRKDTLRFEPKSNYRYSNSNYALLASIIERVSGKKYADFLAAYIFKPLKMKNTFVYNRREKPQKIDNHAIGYVWAKNSFQKVTADDPKYGQKSVYYLDGVVGSAKVNSTVGDLYKWVNALKSDAFFTPEEFAAITEITQTDKGKNIDYGFGLDIRKGDNKFTYGHTGNWDGYTSLIYHDQIKDRTIIVLQNFNLGAIPFNSIQQVLNQSRLTPEFKKKVSLSESTLQQYTGDYTDQEEKEEKHRITYNEGHLIYNTGSTDWDMRFFPISDNEFKGIRQGGADAVIKFNRDDKGKMNMEMLQNGRKIGFGIREE